MPFMREQKIPVRVICRGFSLSRATLYRYLSSPVSHDSLSKRITELAYEHPQYGYRRLSALLHKEGTVVNHKKGLPSLYPIISPKGGETIKKNLFACPCTPYPATIPRACVVGRFRLSYRQWPRIQRDRFESLSFPREDQTRVHPTWHTLSKWVQRILQREIE